MIVRHLTTPLATSLADAQAALTASPAGSEEEWILPDGVSALAGPVSLGDGAYSLRIRGGEGTVVQLTGGTLSVAGLVTALEALRVSANGVASALELSGNQRVEVSGVSVDAQAPVSCTAVTIIASGAGTAQLADLVIDSVQGTEARGLSVTAGQARVTGLTVSHVTASAGAAVAAALACEQAQLAHVKLDQLQATAECVGLELASRDRIDVAGLVVGHVTGVGAVGARALLSQVEGEGLAAVDVSISDVDGGAGLGVGLITGAAGAVRVRGFTVARVKGASALGLLALGGRGIEAAIGQVEDIIGTASAAGARVLGGPSLEPVVIRDVAVERVAGPVPAGAQPDAAWTDWVTDALQSITGAPPGPLTLPALPAAADVVGLHACAPVDEFEPLLDQGDPGEISLEDDSLRVITGTALQLEGGLRTARVRRTEAWTSVFGGWLQSEQLLLAQLTWHRHAHGLRLGPGEIRAYDSIFSALVSGAPFQLEPDAELSAGVALFAQGAPPPFTELGPFPYVQPGAPDLPPSVLTGSLPPPEDVDLRLVPGAAVARAPVAVPGDPDSAPPPFVGAWAPEAEPTCDVMDPQPRAFLAAPEPPVPGALVDYRARDAQALLAVMLERARIVMPTWTDRGPADFTTMLMETLAAQLDQLAYRQERSVGEGFLEDAVLRRSVEDHARPLDYAADPGLSATVMVRFQLDAAVLDEWVKARMDELHLSSLPPGTEPLEFLTEGGVLEIPEQTLVANTSTAEQSLVFATEAPLSYFPKLDALVLSESVKKGAISATLVGVHKELEVGRWLVLYRGRGEGGHVVRATSVERSTDTTKIGWDPRRPAPGDFLAPGDPAPGPRAVVLGNVVPAHHGLPIDPLGDDFDSGRAESFDTTLARWRALLSPTIDGSVDRELSLPFSPVSVQASGYPLPGDDERTGTPMLQLSVEGDPWTLVDDLSLYGPGDEVFVLRSGASGGAAVLFGNGVSGAALPSRTTELGLSLRVGLGRIGNVGEGVLARLLQLPVDEERSAAAGDLLSRPMEEIRRLIRVDNPLPGVGGRDPESLASIRYRAPAGVSEPLSAITADDYVRLLQQLPEVAGAAARVVHADLRTVIRVTVLLRDEDTLDQDELLRRWALVRRRLEEIRLLGLDVEAIPPTWVPLDLDLEVDAAPYARADEVRDGVIAAVGGQGGLLDPDQFGLGGDVQLADLYQAVLKVPGVTAVRVKRFRRLEPQAPERLPDGVIPIGPEEVATVRGGLKPGSDGVLTVSVCGGLR